MDRHIFLFVKSFSFIVIMLLLGCSTENNVVEPPLSKQSELAQKTKDIASYKSQGIQNAIKKARQLTDIEFTPLNPIECNSTTLLPYNTYKGVIYSSVKEIDTYVGENVSFHTFMTAINNPRSKIYTEKINQTPYHGTNCKAYYGTVCSGLVSYALGLNRPRLHSYDFPISDQMEEIEYHILENLQLADVLWRAGHVALITDIIKDEYGFVTQLEISEAIGAKCRRYVETSSSFLNSTMQKFTKIYRYKDIEYNYDYTPVNEFVSVDDETLIPFCYNKDICADKGDKSCYLEGEKVVINVYSENNPYRIEVYKDHNLYMSFESDSLPDITFDSLPYGDYCARVAFYSDNAAGISPIRMNSPTRADGEEVQYSDYTFWTVVNTDIQIEKNNPKILFRSKNAKPIFIYSCNINGLRPPISEGCYQTLNEMDIRKGYIDITNFKMSQDYPYIKIVFSTDYGNIVSEPINWFE